MWTESSRKYYTLLRSREKALSVKQRHGPTAPASTTATAAAQHTLSRETGAGQQASLSARHGRSAVVPELAFVDPSEGRQRVLDPLLVLALAPSEVQKITAVTLANRGLTDIHPNMLLFGSLESLALQSNHLRTVRNLLPPPPRRVVVSPQTPTEAGSGNSADENPSRGGTTTGPCAKLSATAFDPAPSARAATRSRLADHLTGPKGCTRLLCLYLSDNDIVNVLETDIPRLTSLRELYLARNNISDFESTLRALRSLRTLLRLDLSGNPITEEPDYRQRVLRILPQLEVLDRLTVQPEERDAAVVQGIRSRGRVRGNRAHEATSVRSMSDSPTSPDAEGAATATRSVRFQLTPAGGAGNSTAAAAATATTSRVAFGGTYTASAHATGSGRAGKHTPWPTSATMRQLDRRRARFMKQQEREREAEAAAEDAECAAVEEERLAFHAVWGLSGPNMPLSAHQYKQWSAPPSGDNTGTAAASSSSPHGDSSGSGGMATRRRSTGRRRSSQAPAVAPVASVAVSTTELVGPDTVRRLLPLLPARVTSPPPSSADASAAARAEKSSAVFKESRLYDALLDRPAAVADKSSRLHAEWAAESLPQPERLQAMRGAVAASKVLLQQHASRPDQVQHTAPLPPSATASPFATPHSSRPSSAASGADSPLVRLSGNGATAQTLMAVVAAEENAEAARLLTRIQRGKAAMIPSPWEHAPATSTLTLMASDLQSRAVALMRVFLLPQELRMLESQFNGLCELLIVLKHAECAPTRDAAAASGADGTKATRSVSESTTTPATSATAVGGKKKGGAGRGNTVSLVSARDALLQGGALWRLMTQPLLIDVTAAGPSGRRRSAGGSSPSRHPSMTTRGRLNSATGAAPAAGAPVASVGGGGAAVLGASTTSLVGPAPTAVGGVSLPPGTVGPYVEASVESLISTLASETGVWELDVSALLVAVAALHHIDLLTGEPQTVSGDEAERPARHGQAGVSSANAVAPALTVAGDASVVAGVPAEAELDDAANPSFAANTHKKGKSRSQKRSAGALAGKRAGSSAAAPSVGSGDGVPADASTATRVAAGGGNGAAMAAVPRKRLAYLTVNNSLLALMYYLPFVEARVEFFKAQSREAVEAHLQTQHTRTTGVGGVTGGAPEWFRRAQQAEVHRRVLRTQLESVYREGRSSSADSPSESFEAFAARTMLSPLHFATQQVEQVGSLFAH